MSVDCSNPGCAAQSVTKRCAGCRQAFYCSSLCQKENWPVHKKACSSTKNAKHESIACVMLKSQAGGASGYQKATIPFNDDIFNQAPTPISQSIGFPLILRRTKPVSENSARSANDDNAHATWLMIDPGHGFAPPEWQSGVGDVLVVRADRKPLDIAMLAAVTDYVSNILDAFGDGMEGDEVGRKYYQRERLVRFSKGCIRMHE
ncbi:MAG: hypothetical protein L6R38_002439 [Xanthoria sp. 2 TBL-2021]|nr:MAG: hypothetical protein L6R38_002439 [Xanthoria sp. 2 TBL-2021]